MPTYEYECTKGHTFEVVQRISEEPLKRCKVCRSKAQRLISASSFILKGGGWYSDGYSSSKSGGGNGSEASKSSSTGSSDKGSTTSSTKGSSESSSKGSSESSSKGSSD